MDEFLVQVNKDSYREALAVVKDNGVYYLFSSRASGWLPSQPQYITATSMSGPWSDPVNVANTATFSAQSGEIDQLSSGQWAMTADQWAANWPTPGGEIRQLLLPLSFSSSNAFATYEFYPSVQYSDDITTAGQGIFGVQNGKILSVSKPSSSDAGAEDLALANDGVEDVPDAFFTPSTVPFWYQIDLQDTYRISEVDLTTRLVQGSETFYQFNVTGSTDNSSFTLLADRMENVDPGFIASATASEEARYVRINADRVVNNVTGNEADFARRVVEVTVYGQ